MQMKGDVIVGVDGGGSKSLATVISLDAPTVILSKVKGDASNRYSPHGDHVINQISVVILQDFLSGTVRVLPEETKTWLSACKMRLHKLVSGLNKSSVFLVESQELIPFRM